ncbi:MAG: MazG family protein, partial [Nocardioidaceae bacterium]
AVASPAEPPGDDLPARLSQRGGDVVWIAARGESAPGGLPVLVGSADPDGAALVRLIDVMGRLRRECPWNAEQTHDSLAPYLLEETYEVLEALDARDTGALCEELGDLLFQIYFHAQVASECEHDGWTVDDVARGLIDKLVRRHPHVFADALVRHAGDVEANWNRLKASEKKRASVLDGVPAALPALAYADKVLDRLRRAGALSESAEVPSGTSPESRVGADLLRTVQAARTEGVDAETALRRTVRELARRTEV